MLPSRAESAMPQWARRPRTAMTKTSVIIAGTIHGQGSTETSATISGSTAQTKDERIAPKSGRSMDSGIVPAWMTVRPKAKATGAS